MNELGDLKAEAEAAFERGDVEAALSKYFHLLDTYPNNPDILNDLGTVCYASGRVSEGIDYYMEALRIKPDHTDACTNVQRLGEASGLSRVERAKVREAKERILKALSAEKMSPGGGKIRGESGRCESECEQGGRAEGRCVGYVHPLRWHERVARTRRARIFTDTRCNVRCRFCYYVNKHAEAWPARLIKRQIDFAAEAGMRDIDFSGGESSMRKDFVDLISYANQYGFRSVCALTNGLKFADEEFMERAVEAGLTEILFSLHGYDEKNHDWLIQRNGAYRKILRAIELAHKHGVAVRTNTTVMRPNYERLEDIAERIKSDVRPFQCNFILFNEFSEARSVAETFAVPYSKACEHVKAAVDILKGEVAFVNVRYIPFCFMHGYEKHVCDYPQKIYDPFEWSQRMLTLCQQRFLEKPMQFHASLVNMMQQYSHSICMKPASIDEEMAEALCLVSMRSGYVKSRSCTNCKWDPICDGLEESYSRHIGVEELEPAAGDRIMNPLAYREHFYDGYERYLPSGIRQEGVKKPAEIRACRRRPSSRKRISVILPTRDRAAVLSRCLGALAGQEMDADDFEVILVDDGSHDNTKGVAEEFGGKLDLTYLHQDHAGPAAARNLGIRKAASDLVVIINDDAIAESDFLSKHCRLHQDFGMNDRVVVLGSRRFSREFRNHLMNYLYEHVPFYTPLHVEKRGYYDHMHFITFSLSALRSGFSEYGFFDEEFSTPLVEDVELGWRWQNNGARVFFEPSIRACHHHRMTVAGWDDQLIRRCRNNLIKFQKHPELKPVGYFMDARRDEMETFVEKGAEFLERFRTELQGIESKDVSSMPGTQFMGKTIHNVDQFVGIVRTVYPQYCIYRSYSHCLGCNSGGSDEPTSRYSEEVEELFGSGRLVEAYELAKSWTGAEPRNAEAWNDAAVAAFRLGRNAEAVGYAQQASAADPGNVTIKENLQRILRQSEPPAPASPRGGHAVRRAG